MFLWRPPSALEGSGTWEAGSAVGAGASLEAGEGARQETEAFRFVR